MKTLDLYLFLTSYTLTVTAAVLAEFLQRRRARFLIPATVAIGMLVANAIVGWHLDPDNSYLTIMRHLLEERDFSSVAALLMGIAAGFVWFARSFQTEDATSHSRWHAWEPALLATSILLVVLCGQAFIWKELLGYTRHAVTVYAPGFEIEKVADFDDEPLRVVTDDDGDVYVCYDYFKKHGAWGGLVLKFHEDPASGQWSKRTVVESPVLARCYGLAVRDGDLYVSRSGFYPKTLMGQVSYEATGAITQLKDLDGDGYFEYAHDVITGLPGMRAPDTMQQNNGMVFGPDGSLYVTNAGAADRTLDEHPWGGADFALQRRLYGTGSFRTGLSKSLGHYLRT